MNSQQRDLLETAYRALENGRCFHQVFLLHFGKKSSPILLLYLS